MSCEQQSDGDVSWRLRSQFARPRPGWAAARLGVSVGSWHTHTQQHTKSGRVKQGGCFSDGVLVRQRHNARGLVMRERGPLETRAVEAVE